MISLDPETRQRWPGLTSLIVVETDTTVVATQKQRKRERRYYLSSIDSEAGLFQKAIRQHWSIENQCHWVLDTCFREDHNQTCKSNAAKNLGAVRRIVLNILKEDPGVKGSLPAKRRRALMTRAYRERLLTLNGHGFHLESLNQRYFPSFRWLAPWYPLVQPNKLTIFLAKY